jgi:hypothetical protein
MNENRIQFLLEYLQILANLKNAGFKVFDEIARTIKEIEKELSIQEEKAD